MVQMATWSLSLDTTRLRAGASSEPLFVQLAALISEEIRRGRLRPGARVPGTRSLAARLGMNRNTVVAAYAELCAEGWLVTRPAGGSFVSEQLPELKARALSRKVLPAALPERPGFDMNADVPKLAEPDATGAAIQLWGGLPDLRQVPEGALGRAYKRALGWRKRQNLEYQSPAGHPELRAALAEMVATTRGVAAHAENVLVTRGSQMALDLLARLLLRPGDRVAVEEVGYQPAWGVLELARAELVFIPVDRDGLDVSALMAAHAKKPLRAVYLTPHHQYPTTAVLSLGRRLELLAFAAEHQLALLEDDYDHEFHYDGRPLLPLASADPRGLVAYVGTLSKVLAPGLRLGFIVAPRALIAELERVRFLVDRHGDHVLEQAIAELIEDGELQRHGRRMRRLYQARRDALVAALERELGSVLSFSNPRGGMCLWARADPALDVREWCERSTRAGVFFTTGEHYTSPTLPQRRLRYYAQHLRLGFARYAPEELEKAAHVMAQALPPSRGRSPVGQRRGPRGKR